MNLFQAVEMSSGVAAKRPEQARYVPPAARRGEQISPRFETVQDGENSDSVLAHLVYNMLKCKIIN